MPRQAQIALVIALVCLSACHHDSRRDVPSSSCSSTRTGVARSYVASQCTAVDDPYSNNCIKHATVARVEYEYDVICKFKEFRE